MGISTGYIAFKLAQQISPILLTRGIATAVGGTLPIIALTEATNLFQSLATFSDDLSLDDSFAQFMPMAGGTLIQNQVATYPFANQGIAANAIIAQPLKISLQMICPARNGLGFAVKLAAMTALQAILSQHNNSGGTYSVVTPSYIYTDCIMTGLTDISGNESLQAQYRWQWDFIKPLVSLQAAQTALNSLMQRLTNGTPPGTPSGAPAIGLPVGTPANLAA